LSRAPAATQRLIFQESLMSGASPRSTDVNSVESGSTFSAESEQCVDGKKFIPLSFSQQQMWYVCQFQSGTIAYNQPVAWRLTGRPDVRALEQSLNAIIERHEALRTTFPWVEGTAVQCIHHQLALALKVVDLRSFPAAEREAEAQKLILEEARYPFDLAKELLLRASLLQTGDEDYVFIVVVHHIVCDGWSMGILIRELTQLYRTFASGDEVILPDLPLQYSEFSTSQREYLQGEKLETQLAYWKEQLQSAAAVELPADRKRSPVATFRGASQAFALPKDLTAAFKGLCAEQGVFLFMGLLAALQLLVHRYTGESDIVVGAPIAVRKRAKLQSSIGLFLNLIALRADFSADPTFRELLKQVCGVVMGAYQHQDIPFERIVEEVRPVRVPGRSPLFQVTLDQVDPKWIALDLHGIRSAWFPVDNQTSKFDVTLAWFDSPEGLRGWLEYSTDLFDSSTITRMQGHFRTLLEGVIADPDKRVSEIEMLTQDERQQLLVEWNQTQADYRADKCIGDLFEIQARKAPHATAIETDDSRITYFELNRRANQVAHYLARIGVGRESLAGVCLDRSVDLMIALLGILKAGAAYVPLDPAYPRQRLGFMMQDAGVKILLTQQRWAEILPTDGVDIVCLDQEQEQLAQESEENPSAQISADDVAYVIYTSGSTGQPKGVLGLHRGAVNRFAWMWNAYPFEPGEIACAKTSVNFVDSVWELFGPLLAGIPTVMIADEVVKSPRALISALAKHRVTRLVLVPSLLSAMLEAEPDIAKAVPQLKYWVSSGEALSQDLTRRFRRAFPDRILLNLYGSSEVSADVTCYETGEMPADAPVLIGRPIANTQIYILDRNLQPVPIGVPGQLCVSGEGLARGYLNRPEQTAEKFIPHPFSDDKTSRMYLSGDLARYRADGNIEVLGRIDSDHQVKIRGFRIEPGEIESVLRQHPSVAQAVVAAKAGPAGELRLVAYVVQNASAPDGDLVSSLRQHLRERLPEYMVPGAFMVVAALPLLPNGKIDRHALPDPRQIESPNSDAAPRNTTEARIQQVWLEVLQIDCVGTHDNFFDVGGHSLLLAAVHARLLGIFNREIASVDLYQYPTISALAKRLDDGAGEQRPLQHIAERARKQKEILNRRRGVTATRPK
jgi:amino acid adenylation domain-containing protein